MDKKSWFDAHIYDYLVKNNMLETADVFEREANLASSALTFPVTDVPEGYLYKWWATYNEIYRKCQDRVPLVNEGSSNMVGGISNMRRQIDSSSLDREHIAGYVAPGRRDDTYNEGGAQGFLGIGKCLADLSWVEEQFKNEVLDMSLMDESGRKKQKLDPEDGDIGVARANMCPSETSLFVPHLLEDIVRMSSHFGGSKDDEKTSSSN